MNMFHFHILMQNLENPIRFYSASFKAEPVKQKVFQYTKLSKVCERLENGDLKTMEGSETKSRNVKLDKTWMIYPASLLWEVYKDMIETEMFGADRLEKQAVEPSGPCYAPKIKKQKISLTDTFENQKINAL